MFAILGVQTYSIIYFQQDLSLSKVFPSYISSLWNLSGSSQVPTCARNIAQKFFIHKWMPEENRSSTSFQMDWIYPKYSDLVWILNTIFQNVGSIYINTGETFNDKAFHSRICTSLLLHSCKMTEISKPDAPYRKVKVNKSTTCSTNACLSGSIILLKISS